MSTERCGGVGFREAGVIYDICGGRGPFVKVCQIIAWLGPLCQIPSNSVKFCQFDKGLSNSDGPSGPTIPPCLFAAVWQKGKRSSMPESFILPVFIHQYRANMKFAL